MITIYKTSWDAQAAACNVVSAEETYTRLILRGHAAELVIGECPKANCGAEVETEQEHETLDAFASKDW